MEAHLKNLSTPTTRTALSVAATLTLLAASPAYANSPDVNADVAGKTLYIQAGSWLRYSDALISRVYTTTKATLEVKGRGACTKRLCPVTHNNVELWAIRTRIDDKRPDSGPVVTERTLRKGDEGTDVKLAQEALNKTGATINVDGKFGADMQRAIEKFQDANGLNVDGDIGPATRLKLKI